MNIDVFRKKSIIKNSNPKIYQKIPDIINRLMDGPPFEYYYNIHKLKGKLKDFWSINITGDWRIVFDINNENMTIYLHDIGSNSELY